MSNSRRMCRQIQAINGRYEAAENDRIKAELDQVAAAWEVLTDDVVRMLAVDDVDGAVRRANDGRREIAAKHDAVSQLICLLPQPSAATKRLAAHVRR